MKRYLQEAGVQVYAIDLLNQNSFSQVGPDTAGPLMLESICEAGGGRRMAVEDLTNLPEVIAKLAHEIRYEYILGYYPSALVRPGKYHRVELKLSRPHGLSKVSVRWRHGYYEPRDGQ